MKLTLYLPSIINIGSLTSQRKPILTAKLYTNGQINQSKNSMVSEIAIFMKEIDCCPIVLETN